MFSLLSRYEFCLVCPLLGALDTVLVGSLSVLKLGGLFVEWNVENTPAVCLGVILAEDSLRVFLWLEWNSDSILGDRLLLLEDGSRSIRALIFSDSFTFIFIWLKLFNGSMICLILVMWSRSDYRNLALKYHKSLGSIFGSQNPYNASTLSPFCTSASRFRDYIFPSASQLRTHTSPSLWLLIRDMFGLGKRGFVSYFFWKFKIWEAKGIRVDAIYRLIN
jgi:hypothetical protein